MDFRVVQIEEFVVQVFLEVVWIDVVEDGTFSSTGIPVQPDVRISVAFEEIPFLICHGFESFSINKEVSGILGKSFIFFTGVDKRPHVDEDFVDLTFLFFFGGFDTFAWLVLGQFSILIQTKFGHVDFAEFFEMVSSPSGVRQISVPRHEIITVSLFDTPIRKDR